MQMFKHLRCAASGIQNFIRGFEPWGILLAIVGLLISVIAFMVEMEDRQSERIFRAWEFVLENERLARSYDDDMSETLPTSGNATAQALEYLNREFEGRFCADRLRFFLRWLTGNIRHICLIPSKQRSSLEDRYLREVVLEGINLPKAKLRKADLMKANLESAYLAGADLRKSELERADLSGADLTGANLKRSTLIDATLKMANLTDARLWRANLTDANLIKADFTGAELEEVNFTDAVLRYAIFEDADFEGAIFSGTDISGARMRGAKRLKPTQLRGACVSEGEPDPELPADISIDWSKKPCRG